MTLKNTNNHATITVSNRQVSADDVEETKTCHKGKFYIKNEKFYVLYEDETGPVTLTIDKVRTTMKRSGPYSSFMRFEVGKEDRFLYHTPYGAMEMELICSRMDAEFSDTYGTLYLQYDLKFNGENVQNNLTIHVRKDCI